MKSEEQKRKEEISKLVRDKHRSGQADIAFQEKVRKAAAQIFEEETIKLRQTERPERPKRWIHPAPVGLWLVVLGVAAFVLEVPSFGAMLVVSGIAALVWEKLPASIKRKRSRASSKAR
ncbi:MAG TPA: hypothetical protein VNO43_15990 [Candidatus Eisenbacteria bacterium]|nr:hypothetical protein [Candidatus Eisenbacteria bacterium]